MQSILLLELHHLIQSILLLELHHLIALFKERAAINNGLCPSQNKVAMRASYRYRLSYRSVLSCYRYVLPLAWEVDKFKLKQGFGHCWADRMIGPTYILSCRLTGILLAIMARPPLTI